MREVDLAALTKKELMGIARAQSLAGRSNMSKAELITALASPVGDTDPSGGAGGSEDGAPTPTEGLAPIAIPGISPEDRAQARARRRVMSDRLASLVDTTRHCPWKTIEGYPCGLPVVVGTAHCGLHSDGLIYDRAIPLTGSLGFASWPTLWRHLTLATYDSDAFGLDPIIAEMAWHLLNGMYYDYFRVEVEGIQHVPMQGGAVLAANHGGAALPYDAAMLMLSVLNEAEQPRRVRVIGTEIFNMLPFVSHLYRKVGAAYAARDDARELLRRGHLLGVFPEGERGFMKPVWEAYRVGRLGRGGFAEIAHAASVPIVPVAIVGSEEVHPAAMVSKRLARLVRLFFPEQRVDEVAVALNPLPLPIRWRIRFLPPVMPKPGPTDALELLEHTEDIRHSIQHALDDILSARKTAF
ncbi:MAG: 1-acyl-sn-glycerol-3-phosphate acyltransferase [Acidimicrobiia bacterium]